MGGAPHCRTEYTLLFSSKDFLDYQSTIAQKYFGGQVDLSSQKNLDKLMEELSAYIAGDIHEGDQRGVSAAHAPRL